MRITLFELVEKLEEADTQEDIVNGFIDYLTGLPEHILSKEILWKLSRTCSDILIVKKAAELKERLKKGAWMKKKKESTYINCLNLAPNITTIITIIEGFTEWDQKLILNTKRDGRMSTTLLSALNFISQRREES